MDFYNHKVTEWKHKTDIQSYRFPIVVSTGEVTDSPKPKKKRRKYDDMSIEEKENSNHRRIQYYKKRINYLTDMAIHNDLTTHIVLTFAKDVYDYPTAKHEWELFLKRLKYLTRKKFNREIMYICTHELQERRTGISIDGVPYKGIYHFHLLCDLGFFPIEDLQALWHNGHVFIRKINTSCPDSKYIQLHYIFKYIVKDILRDQTRAQSSARKIFISRNLKKPVVTKLLTNDTVEDIIFDHMEDVHNTYTYDIILESGTVNNVDIIQIKKD